VSRPAPGHQTQASASETVHHAPHFSSWLETPFPGSLNSATGPTSRWNRVGDGSGETNGVFLGTPADPVSVSHRAAPVGTERYRASPPFPPKSDRGTKSRRAALHVTLNRPFRPLAPDRQTLVSGTSMEVACLKGKGRTHEHRCCTMMN
jgi:hypothetical protein